MHGCTPLVLVLSLTPGHPIHLGTGVEMDWWEEKHTSTRAHPHVGKSSVLGPGQGHTPMHRQAGTLGGVWT